MGDPRPIVVYHGGCLDGRTAAWCVRRALRRTKGDVELVPAGYGDEPPDASGRDVFIVDFSYPRAPLLELVGRANRVTLLDHHASALRGLGDLVDTPVPGLSVVFDMERSGARIAWDYFNPDQPPPWWLRRVEDRDLWRFSHDDTHRVYAYMMSLPDTVEVLDELHQESYTKVVEGGAAIRRHVERRLSELVRNGEVRIIHRSTVAAANVPYQDASELAGMLLEKFPHALYAACYFRRGDGEWQFSLRSRGADACDVSRVAERFGGGGHAAAAGFRVKTLAEVFET